MEFALVLPLLIVLLAMAIDLGRVFYGWVSIQNAARVGASYAAANADAWEAPTDATRQARYATLVQNDLQALNCSLAAVPPPAFTDSDANGTYDTGEPVDVNLDCTFALITPIGQTILGPVSLGAESTYPVHYTIRTASAAAASATTAADVHGPVNGRTITEYGAQSLDGRKLPIRKPDRERLRQFHCCNAEPNGRVSHPMHLLDDDCGGCRPDASALLEADSELQWCATAKWSLAAERPVHG